jgi:hypothetical protein
MAVAPPRKGESGVRGGVGGVSGVNAIDPHPLAEPA